MHPRSWGTLAKIKQATTANNMPLLLETPGAAVARSIYGVPVFLSSQLSVVEGTAESSAYVYDASQIIAVFRQDTSITLDRSRLFNTDQASCVHLRADLVVPNPLAVVRISKFRVTGRRSRSMPNVLTRWWERRSSLATPSPELLALFSSGPTESGAIVSPQTALSVPAVFSCCQVLSQDVARTPIRLRQKTADDTYEDAVDHPLWEILHDLANPEQTAFQVKHALQWQLLVYGRAYAEIVPGGRSCRGAVAALLELCGSIGTVHGGSDGPTPPAAGRIPGSSIRSQPPIRARERDAAHALPRARGRALALQSARRQVLRE